LLDARDQHAFAPSWRAMYVTRHACVLAIGASGTGKRFCNSNIEMVKSNVLHTLWGSLYFKFSHTKYGGEISRRLPSSEELDLYKLGMKNP